MEYCDDGNLSELISKRTTYFSRKQIINWFKQLVSGLGYLHEQQILHKNIKLENVLIYHKPDKKRVLKLADADVSDVLST